MGGRGERLGEQRRDRNSADIGDGADEYLSSPLRQAGQITAFKIGQGLESFAGLKAWVIHHRCGGKTLFQRYSGFKNRSQIEVILCFDPLLNDLEFRSQQIEQGSHFDNSIGC